MIKTFDICNVTTTKTLKNEKKKSDVVDILDKYEINVEETYTSAGHVLISNTVD